MGTWIRLDEVLKYGNRRMYAVDKGNAVQKSSTQDAGYTSYQCGRAGASKVPGYAAQVGQGNLR